MRAIDEVVRARHQVLPAWTAAVVEGGIVGVMIVAEKEPIRWIDHPVSPCQIEVHALPERYCVRIAGRESELGDHRCGHGHRCGQIAVYVLEGAEEEEFVPDDPSAAV